ncbi:hypothetical protein L6164_031137 [Bauhinia variegata]|uniref:Uncharacterized protein n=1 Tax=Bauhinia variegata TaxID=167791 RepID=A0ACB9LEY0_BAUVA|nr:hypothetical protein L6164_031137 [Bauhinia variegata]
MRTWSLESLDTRSLEQTSISSCTQNHRHSRKEEEPTQREMGCRNREFFSEDETSSPSPCEALLFATMCIIGLPVDVHVKDGSVYSGIFHTASVDRDYGAFALVAVPFSGKIISGFGYLTESL